MYAELLSATVLLILVTDPFGNVPLVVAALREVPRERRLRVVVRECLIAYLLLLVFLFGGKAFLELMHLSETSVSIAGGVILFLIALRMVFPSPGGVFGDGGTGEPFIVPLAIPAIAGPSALATVMLLASRVAGIAGHAGRSRCRSPWRSASSSWPAPIACSASSASTACWRSSG